MGFEETISDESMVAVQKDYEYLTKMKLMDKEIIKKRKREKKGKKGDEGEGEREREGKFEMTDVVPVAGLIMARFTMYECEYLTALELWGQRKSGFDDRMMMMVFCFVVLCCVVLCCVMLCFDLFCLLIPFSFQNDQVLFLCLETLNLINFERYIMMTILLHGMRKMKRMRRKVIYTYKERHKILTHRFSNPSPKQKQKQTQTQT